MNSARKYLYVAVRAVKNHLFAEGGDALDIGGAGVGCEIKIKVEQEKECEVAGIKALVEAYRLNIDVNLKYLCRTQSDAQSLLYLTLNVRRKEASQILKTVAVAAGVIYSPCINAYRLLEGR